MCVTQQTYVVCVYVYIYRFIDYFEVDSTAYTESTVRISSHLSV